MTWLVQLFLVEACAATAASKNVGVTVEVRTQWRSSVHSTLLEAAEHLEEFHGSETFWKLVDTVERGGPAWRKSGLLDAQAVCTAVAPIVDDMALAIMNVSLSARAMAPRVQFFSSIAAASRGDAACATFATVNGAAALCDAKSVASALGAANGATGAVGDVTLFPFDHIYPAESNGAPLIAVYGRLGSPSLSRLHAAAAAAAAAGKARYVLRLTLGEVVESDSTAAGSEREIETVALGGFGIALDIKSMEYKALDDSAPVGAMDGGDEEQGEGEGAGKGADEALDAAETVGVVFSTLARRYPHLDNELRAAKETLATSAAADALASAEGGEDLKVWDMTDLGLQATQRVMAAADPLAKLREIAQNFPAYAKQLSRVSVDPKLRAEIAMLPQRIMMQPGTSSLIINGAPYPAIETVGFNTFALIADLAKASEKAQMVSELKLSGEQRTLWSALLFAGSKSSPLASVGAAPVRVNVRSNGKGAVHFANNIERDMKYKKWPRSIRTILTPSWSLHQVRRNLYTTIVAGDPVLESTLRIVKDTLAVVGQLIPIRLGFVFTSPQLAEWANAQIGAADDAASFFAALDAGGLTAPAALVAASAVARGQTGGGDAARPATTLEFLSLMHALKQNGTRSQVNSFLQRLAADAGNAASRDFVGDAHGDERRLTVGALRGAFVRVTRGRDWKGAAPATLLAAALETGDVAPLTPLALRAAAWAGTKNLPLPSILINGRVAADVSAADAVRGMMPTVGDELQRIQQLVQRGKLRGKKLNVLTKILKGDNVHERYDAQILSASAEFVALLPSRSPPRSVLPFFASGDTAPGANAAAVVSVIVVADLSSAAGLRLAAAALEGLRATQSARVALLHEGGAGAAAGAAPRTVLRAALALAARCGASGALSASEGEQGKGAALLARALRGPLLACATNGGRQACAPATLRAAIGADLADAAGSVLSDTTPFAAEGDALALRHEALRASWLSLGASAHALVVNGRVLRYDAARAPPRIADIALAVAIERKRSARAIANRVLRVAASPEGRVSADDADAVMAATSVLGSLAYTGDVAVDGRARALKLKQRVSAPRSLTHTVIRPARGRGRGGDASTAVAEKEKEELTRTAVEVFAVLDPLSETAQRAAGVLVWLRDTLGEEHIDITIVLNPSTATSELPLSRFYRFVGGSATAHPTALFRNMPAQHILTMKVETPEAWIVQAERAEHDLDNIRLGDEQSMGGAARLHARFLLKRLLVTGSCADEGSRVPPNGLQLNLFDAASDASNEVAKSARKSAAVSDKEVAAVSDTVVMQNLGYFQLQAAPGRWRIRLAEGRATDLFELATRPRAEGTAAATFHEVLLHDFVGSARMTKLVVRKQLGKELDELLETVKDGGSGSGSESEGGASLWSKVSSLVTGKKKKPTKKSVALAAAGGDAAAVAAAKEEEETVHVFSLASGHLYERLMRIMMLSVTKRTSAPVKFWLVENFLSPHFKSTVFAMAKEFGFQVELITYKWPEWLRRQTEKQRIIWGYKILFLDVLFPLDVHKIIYVDADQVVRADLKELWELDLHGAPYGYTPMCKTNPETVGFQFWEQGYWKEHLQGKPYHISALYVVDLDVFRQRGVADMLRGTYDQLSRDPNSLSNLDQDLPNYAQHQVPIFSLPQEWLWCESWCSGASKAKAKTVDLCNNPLHKESKLDMAKRVISGPLFQESWVELDSEVRDFIEGRATVGVEADSPSSTGASAAGSKREL